MSESAVRKQPQLDFADLLAYPKQCADAVRPYIQGANLESYTHFLEMMYHYTLGSEAKCMYAAEQTTAPELKEYFFHMAKEERGHYRLAEKDLEGFGQSIDKTHTPTVVTEFNDFWYQLGKRSPNEFAGAILVFEGIADYLATDVVNLLNRLQLNKKQSRWLRIHIEADHDHGAEAVAICRQYFDHAPEAMEAAAAKASVMWSNVFKEAFKIL